MIKEFEKTDISDCVEVIKESFMTVADELGFTVDNAPRFTAFAISEDRLRYQLENEHRLMIAY
ncbi:MAG: GNAT family N-acetyltransferase, partial [Clostridia bacterium]|nr:GNAT family N-acetyltransferase [Clostridia bacterium]